MTAVIDWASNLARGIAAAATGTAAQASKPERRARQRRARSRKTALKLAAVAAIHGRSRLAAPGPPAQLPVSRTYLHHAILALIRSTFAGRARCGSPRYPQRPAIAVYGWRR